MAMKVFVLSLLAVFLAISFTHAQVPSLSPYKYGVFPAILNTAGGTSDNANSYFRYEWSFGESILIQSFSPSDSSLLLTQGVIQPCAEKGPSSHTLIFDEGDYKIFPNPTAGKFELDFFIQMTGKMKLQLIDATGRILETRTYHYDGCCRIELFDLGKYAAGLYYVVADLRPDADQPGGNAERTRHSGLKVIKINE
jgi:hypothetical protein